MYLELSRLDDRMPLMTSDKVFSNMVGGVCLRCCGAIFVVVSSLGRSGVVPDTHGRDCTGPVDRPLLPRPKIYRSDSAESDEPNVCLCVVVVVVVQKRPTPIISSEERKKKKPREAETNSILDIHFWTIAPPPTIPESSKRRDRPLSQQQPLVNN
jgi:hypothetical protein